MGSMCACCLCSAAAVGAGVAAVGIGLGIINPDPPLWSMPILPLPRPFCPSGTPAIASAVISGCLEPSKLRETHPVLLLALPPTGSPPTRSLPTSSPSILRECYYLGSSIASHLTDQPCQRFRVVGIHQHRGKPAWFPFSALPLPHRYPFSSCLLLTPSPHPFFGSIATFSSSTASPVTGLPACNCGLPGTIEIVGNPPGFCSRHSCLLITAHPPARSAPPPSPIRFIPLYARYVLPSTSLVPLLNTPAASIHPDSRQKLIR